MANSIIFENDIDFNDRLQTAMYGGDDPLDEYVSEEYALRQVLDQLECAYNRIAYETSPRHRRARAKLRLRIKIVRNILNEGFVVA